MNSETAQGSPDLARALSAWQPGRVELSGRLDLAPAVALAEVLGVSPPAIGEQLPLLWHEVYLREVFPPDDLGEDGHPRSSRLVPPIHRRQRLFGGGRLEVLTPLVLGTEVRRVAEVSRTRLKSGSSGQLLVVDEHHEWFADDTLCVREDRQLIYRSLVGSTAAPGPASSQVQTVVTHDDEVALTYQASSALLARFSDLTGNQHRIHTDLDYARNVEGHRGLLVHGPLSALLALETVRRMPNCTPRIFDFRLVAPAYAEAPLTFRVMAGSDPGEWEVVGSTESSAFLRATVRC